MPALTRDEIAEAIEDENLPDHEDAEAVLEQDALDVLIPDTSMLYNVQCISGEHVFYADQGSDLEKECIARDEQGYLDALTLGPNECPYCIREREERDRKMDYYMSL